MNRSFCFGFKLALIFIIVGAAFYLFPQPSIAHKLSVFAFVENNVLVVEGRLPKGKRPRQGAVKVFNGKGKLLIESEIGPGGESRFPLPEWDTGLKIILDIGDGHKAQWILTPLDIEEQLNKNKSE